MFQPTTFYGITYLFHKKEQSVQQHHDDIIINFRCAFNWNCMWHQEQPQFGWKPIKLERNTWKIALIAIYRDSLELGYVSGLLY